MIYYLLFLIKFIIFNKINVIVIHSNYDTYERILEHRQCNFETCYKKYI